MHKNTVWPERSSKAAAEGLNLEERLISGSCIIITLIKSDAAGRDRVGGPFANFNRTLANDFPTFSSRHVEAGDHIAGLGCIATSPLEVVSITVRSAVHYISVEQKIRRIFRDAVFLVPLGVVVGLTGGQTESPSEFRGSK